MHVISTKLVLGKICGGRTYKGDSAGVGANLDEIVASLLVRTDLYRKDELNRKSFGSLGQFAFSCSLDGQADSKYKLQPDSLDFSLLTQVCKPVVSSITRINGKNIIFYSCLTSNFIFSITVFF